MLAKRWLCALLAVPVLMAAEAASPPEGWKEYSPKDRSFSVWVPEKGGKVADRRATVSLRGAGILKLTIAEVQMKDGPTYGASTVVLPLKVMRSAKPDEMIEAFRDAFIKDGKGKIVKETEIKQDRVTGKEYLIETVNGMTRLRLYAAGRRVFQASASGSKEQVEGKEATTFLESYKLPRIATLKPPRKGKDK